MARQIALPILWFFAAWSAASMIAFALGLNDAIVPLVAIGSAAVAYGQGASRRAAIHRPATSVAGQSTFVAGQ